MKRMLTLQPDMTASDLSVVLKKSPKWVYDQLNLLELTEEEQRMVNLGEIPLKSAYMLAKFPRFLRREEIGSIYAADLLGDGRRAHGLNTTGAWKFLSITASTTAGFPLARARLSAGRSSEACSTRSPCAPRTRASAAKSTSP